MLEIVFLGTGSGIPDGRRNHSAIWLQYEDEAMLWDCGEGTQRQLMIAKKSFMKIDRIFITHWHADHWAGLIGLMQTMNMEHRKKPLYIYGPDAERFVSDILDLDYWGPRFEIKAANVPYEGDEPNLVYHSKEFDVLSIPVKHTVPSVAYMFKERDYWNVDIKKAEKLYGLKQSPLIGVLKEKGRVILKGKTVTLEEVGIKRSGLKAVYSGDTKYCENLVKLSKGADLLIHDATFAEEEKTKMHSGVGDAAQVAKKAGVKQLILTHFSRRYRNVKELEEDARKIFKNTQAAQDFMRVELKHEIHS
jgi:ribonuclease Z